MRLAKLIVLIIMLCVTFFSNREVKEIKNITYFNYSTVDGMAYNDTIDYKIECNDKCVATIKERYVDEEDSIIVDITQDDFKRLESILNKYNVGNWDGFHKSDNGVLDGSSFSIYIKMENGDSISASGYMKWPKNYRDVRSELENYFNSLINEDIL